jgi:hypothetical protein
MKTYPRYPHPDPPPEFRPPPEVESAEAMAARLHRAVMEQTEQLLRERISLRLGREPTLDEVERRGHCLIHGNGVNEYKWDGVTVLTVTPPAFGDLKQTWNFT